MSLPSPCTAETVYSRIEAQLGQGSFPERRFTVAGNTVSLQASSEELLARLWEAFSHLSPTEASPDVTIRVGVAGSEFDPETLEGGQTVGGHRFWVSSDRRFICHTIFSSGSWYCVDRAAGQIVGTVASVDRMSTYERAKPVVRPLLFWLEQKGLIPVHAGMVCWKGNGILLGGRGGSGKSTTALVSLQGGLEMLAEDYTLLEQVDTPSGQGFRGHSLYSSAWVEPDHLRRLPKLTAEEIPGDAMANGKTIMQLRSGYRDQLIEAAPVRHLVLPRVRPGKPCALTPASRADGLKRFALESMVTLTRLGRHELQRLSELVQTVDCYWLDLGDDLNRVPSLLKGLVEQQPDL